jgi:anti-anti-sigma factor
MRINSLRPNSKYVELARKIAEIMPTVGSDRQRGGWYDVMEREKGQGQDWYRFTWHDRKAWWQQEQAILAYLILTGILGDDEYRKEARYAAAFYNAFFLDHDAGAVYFNVLASGMPYLLGTERLKGSHSMSAYHNTELCYLAAVYTNLLITKQPLDLHFKPRPDAWKDRILRVSPDILPPGSIKIEQVWIDGQPWTEFDAAKLTVTLPPPAGQALSVKVRVVSALETFESEVQVSDGTASIVLTGKLDETVTATLERDLERALSSGPQRVVLRAESLESMSSAGARALLFLRQKLPFEGVDLVIVGAKPEIQEACRMVDTDEQSFQFVDDVKKLKPLK